MYKKPESDRKEMKDNSPLRVGKISIRDDKIFVSWNPEMYLLPDGEYEIFTDTVPLNL